MRNSYVFSDFVFAEINYQVPFVSFSWSKNFQFCWMFLIIRRVTVVVKGLYSAKIAYFIKAMKTKYRFPDFYFCRIRISHGSPPIRIGLVRNPAAHQRTGFRYSNTFNARLRAIQALEGP